MMKLTNARTVGSFKARLDQVSGNRCHLGLTDFNFFTENYSSLSYIIIYLFFQFKKKDMSHGHNYKRLGEQKNITKD